MGLDTSHDCWHGPYSMFMRWRRWLADQIGVPLDLMEGFCAWTLDDSDYEVVKTLPHSDSWMALVEIVRGLVGKTPFKWEAFKPDPLHLLLHHSDCDGEIRWQDCKAIADRLTEIADGAADDHDPERPPRGCYDGMIPAARRFAAGLMRAHEAQEDVEFR